MVPQLDGRPSWEPQHPIHREPWNKGKLVGQKAPFKLKEIWAPRVRLHIEGRVRELALFNLGIDSKLERAPPSAIPAGSNDIHNLPTQDVGLTLVTISRCRFVRRSP